MSLITPGYISEMLSAQAEAVVRELLPLGKRVGNEWCVGSTGGEAGNSCKVHLTGNKAGIWSDFAEGGRGGDLLDLWVAVRSCDLRTAMDQACKYLGVTRPEFAGQKKRVFKRPEKSRTMKPLEKVAPVMNWLLARGIKEDTLVTYKVVADRIAFEPPWTEMFDVAVFPYLRGDELIHLKYRAVTEKKFRTSAETEKCLFGWQAIPPKARSVVLTEGELDAMTMYQYGFPALSLPFGGGKGGKQDWIDGEFDNLERFDIIYLCLDMDDEGRIAAAEIIDRLGRSRCRVVQLPHKDPNECLKQGTTKDEMAFAIRESRTVDPSELRNAMEYRDSVVRRFYPVNEAQLGFFLPWSKAVDKFKFGWGETTVVAGVNGHGKSEMVGQLVIDAGAQDVKACVASLEFKPDKWIARIVRQMTCAMIPEIKKIDQAMHWLQDKLWAFDVEGHGAGTAKVDRLLEVFEYARQRYGCRLFVIDNFSKLGIGEDDLNEQKRAISLITEFSVEHDVHIIVVMHMRKNESDDVRSGKMGVKGSSSLTDLVDNLWVVWRNRKKEASLRSISMMKRGEMTPDELSKVDKEKKDLLEKGDTYFICEKYRMGEEEPRLKLFFDSESHQFVEEDGSSPRRYV